MNYPATKRKSLDQNTECYINIDFCIFTQVTTSTIMVIHANDFAQLNALKIKSNVAKNKLQQAAYKTISAFTKDLIGITLSFVTDFAQSNVKMMKWNAQLLLNPMVARKLKTAFQNKKTMRETSVLTNNALLNVPKQDICAKEMSTNMDAKKKMYVF